jgi:hypothetical protein
VVIRFNQDGIQDPTFGTNGVETLDFAGGDDQATGVAIDPNGSIVVVGTTTTGGTTEIAVAKLNGITGLPDPTFGPGGRGNCSSPRRPGSPN